MSVAPILKGSTLKEKISGLKCEMEKSYGPKVSGSIAQHELCTGCAGCRAEFDVCACFTGARAARGMHQQATASEPARTHCPNPPRMVRALPIRFTLTEFKFLPSSRAWLHCRRFDQHADHPYPSDADKLHLAGRAGISQTQVSTWFLNRRKRREATAGHCGGTA